MSFAENTGRTRRGRCEVCGLEVTQEEVRLIAGRAPAGTTSWHPVEHKAPCGAHCAGGGTDPHETDVHLPAFSPCPRCGAVDSVAAKIIERADGQERVVIYRYTVSYLSGFRIDLQVLQQNRWIVKARWGSHSEASLELAEQRATKYVGWLCDSR